jgi:hypothetical protein
MRHSHRHDRGSASLEHKAPLASLDRQPTLKHEVALVLGMGVTRRRRVVRKQELDQSEAPVDYLPRDPDRRQRSEEPQTLALPRTGRGRHLTRAASHIPSVSNSAVD